ncbi:flagellar protein FlaG [Bacillus sp. 1P06AnD]|uniref:flagellar protein FlaG n=1 Tax=Bacillus sp. 1P06AnD TaxID=3132208 RepID=UPI0039A17E82
MIHKVSIPVDTTVSNGRNTNSSPINQNVNKENNTEDVLLRKEHFEKIVDSMNSFIDASTTHVRFQFHDKLQEYYVSVVNNDTQEVVREIPPKKFLDMYASMMEQIGWLVDKKI